MPPRQFHLKRTDIWREGKWVDLWSAVHLLSGISTGLLLSRAGTFNQTIVPAVLLFIAYEAWEAYENIKETPQNRVMDVVIGTLGFLIAFGGGFTAMPTYDFMMYASFIIGFNIVFATFGWYASQKAAALEERIRRRLKERRRRFREQRARFVARLHRNKKEPFA